MKRTAAILLAALLSACTGAADTGRPGLLVVVGDDGNVAVVAPDGSSPVAVTDDAGPDRAYHQPTWSPDGSLLAFVEIRENARPGILALAAARDEIPWQVRIAAPDGETVASLTTPFAPFYLAWSPDGNHLAMLGNDGETIGLAIARPTGGPSTLLDRGAPYYLSWAPEGDRLLTHVGADRLGVLDLDGSTTPLSAAPGPFRAPAWDASGRMAYVERSDGRRQLVFTEPDASEPRPVATIGGSGAFVVSPDGSRLAYVDTVSPGAATLGPLFVAGEGSVRHVTTEPVVAFSWSPDGRRLLYLRAERAGTEAWFWWGVWDGETTVEFPRFRPSAVLASQYLPFFDQYAQSLSFWAPDGSAFVYAGAHEQGGSGVWVQSIEPGAVPARVAAGSFAAWSP